MSKACSNSKTGCNGIAQRGNILCDQCIEARKSMSKNKREHDLDEILEKNKKLDEELKQYKQKCSSYEIKISELSNKMNSQTNFTTFNSHLEKDITKLNDIINKLRLENTNLNKDKGIYEMSFSQTKLDIEKLTTENKTLTTLNTELQEKNKMLTEENEKMYEILNKSKSG